MPLTTFATVNANRDLTATVTVLTDTPDAANARMCHARIVLGDGVDDLDGTGGAFELTVSVGGVLVQPDPLIIGVTATTTRAALYSEFFAVDAGEEVLLRVKSPNGADTDVDVTATLWDANSSSDMGITLQRTIIATLASQTSFTLAAGSADNDAYNGAVIVVEDAATAAQKAIASISDYAGGTKTVTLAVDPGVFTMAIGDTVTILATATAMSLLDRTNTGTTHNIVNSVGRQIRQAVESSVIDSGTAQGSGTGNNQIQLATTASAVDGAYDPAAVVIIDNTGAMQTRLIYQYDGGTRTATVDRDWKVLPDATSVYLILAHPGREHVNEGLAQAGTASTITLNTLGSSQDDAYNGQTVFIRSGIGQDQSRLVIDYDGTSKIATVNRKWDITPTTQSGYVMLPWDGGLPLAGITSLAEWLGIIAGKQVGDATALTELRATGAGSGTVDPTTDSQEAQRDITVSVDGSPLAWDAALRLVVRHTDGDWSITGTTLTHADADGTIATYTLDSATEPTSRTKD